MPGILGGGGGAPGSAPMPAPKGQSVPLRPETQIADMLNDPNMQFALMQMMRQLQGGQEQPQQAQPVQAPAAKQNPAAMQMAMQMMQQLQQRGAGRFRR